MIMSLCVYIIKTHCLLYLCVFKRSLLGVKTCLSHAQIGLLYLEVTKNLSHAQLVSFRG